MPVSASSDPACSTASGRSPTASATRSASRCGEVGGQPAQQPDRLGPGELAYPHHVGDPAPGRVARGDQHLAGAVGQEPGQRAGVLGVVEHQQPPIPPGQLAPQPGHPDPDRVGGGGEVQGAAPARPAGPGSAPDPRRAPTRRCRTRRGGGGRTRSPWWSCRSRPSRSPPAPPSARRTAVPPPARPAARPRPVNSAHPRRDRPHPPLHGGRAASVGAERCSGRGSAVSACSSAVSSPAGLVTVAVVTPLSASRARKASWRGPVLQIAEHRRRALGVFTQQEHQPRDAPLLGGLVLQLGVGQLRPIPHRRPVPEPGDQHEHVRRRNRVLAHPRRLVVAGRRSTPCPSPRRQPGPPRPAPRRRTSAPPGTAATPTCATRTPAAVADDHRT